MLEKGEYSELDDDVNFFCDRLEIPFVCKFGSQS